MRTLAIDIETSPNLAYVFQLWREDVPLARLIESTEMLCFAASWMDDKKVHFRSRQSEGGRWGMVQSLYRFLDTADAVVTWNGKRFDQPHWQRELLEAGITPPSPYKHIDLFQAVRKEFRFPSNKLDYVSQILGHGSKKGVDFDLWKGCMNGDETAWKRMRRYNEQDVKLLKTLYLELRPWISNHPSVVLHDDELGEDTDRCPTCGSGNLKREGYAVTQTSKFQRYQCRDCGKWSRSGRRLAAVDVRPVAA